MPLGSGQIEVNNGIFNQGMLMNSKGLLSEKGQTLLPLLFLMVTLSGLLFLRLNAFTAWLLEIKERHRIYLCSKEVMSFRERHSKEVATLNKIIIGSDIAMVLNPEMASQARESAKKMQLLSLAKLEYQIAKNQFCSMLEKAYLSMPLFEFNNRNILGLLPYRQKQTDFYLKDGSGILWIRSHQEDGPLSGVQYSTQTINRDNHIGNFWSGSQLSSRSLSRH